MYDIFHNTENTKYLKGNCHEQLTWKRQPELFKFDSRRHQCKAKPSAYDGRLTAKEITPNKLEQILWTKSGQKTWHVATNEFT